MKCHLFNPAYRNIVNRELETYFESRQCAEKPIICGLRKALDEYKVPTQPVLPFKTASQYSGTPRPPDINVELAVMKKNQAPCNVWRSMYEEVVRQCGDYKLVYTDESKRDSEVGAAACMEDHVKRVALPTVASIYTAEKKVIQLSLEIIENSAFTSFIISTNSMSSIKVIVNMSDRSMLLQKLRHRFIEVVEVSKRVKYAGFQVLSKFKETKE